MDHDAWEALTGPYVDDALPLEVRDAFERHAAGCAECSSSVFAQGAVRRRIHEARERAVASDAFRHRVYKRLLEDNPHIASEQGISNPSLLQLPIPMEP